LLLMQYRNRHKTWKSPYFPLRILGKAEAKWYRIENRISLPQDFVFRTSNKTWPIRAQPNV
jgi:hypothetical protein